jgi:hypothetical protein
VSREATRIDLLAADMQRRVASDIVQNRPEHLAREVSALRMRGGLAISRSGTGAGRVLMADGGPAVFGAPHADLRAGLEAGRGAYDFRIELNSAGSWRAGWVSLCQCEPCRTRIRRSPAAQCVTIALGLTLILALHVLLTRWVLAGVLDGVAGIETRAIALRRAEVVEPLPVHGDDALARLTRAFNQMVQALDERVMALRKSEARFHAIADFTFGVEAWFGPQGRLIWVNRSIERVTGHSPLDCLLSEESGGHAGA